MESPAPTNASRRASILRRWLLAGLAASLAHLPVGAAGQTFEALGIGPGDLGESIPRSQLWMRNSRDGLPAFEGFSLAALPVSQQEREQALAGFRKARWEMQHDHHLYVAQVLEGWEMLRECLDWLEADAAPASDPLHLVRLRWRLGEFAAAEAAFSHAQSFSDGRLPRLSQRGTSLIRPLFAAGRLDELNDFLAWLQPRCLTAAFRLEILRLRLDLAWHRDTLDADLARIRNESAILGHCAAWLLTANPAMLPENPETLPPDDLILLFRCASEVPAITHAALTLIETTSLTPAQRVELPLVSLDHNGQSTIITRSTTLPLKDDLQALANIEQTLADLLSPGQSPILPTETLMALADRHPAHAAVNLLAGMVHLRQSGTQSPPEAPFVALLTRAFVHWPLLDAPASLERHLTFSAADRFDPAGFALTGMAFSLDAASMLRHLRNHPDFAKLPPHQQARHLALARLDRPFLEAMADLDWSQPVHDHCPGWVAHYFRNLNDRDPDPADPLIERLATIIPAMVAGSPEKDPAAVRSHAKSMIGILRSVDFPAQRLAAIEEALHAAHPPETPTRDWRAEQDPLAVLFWFQAPQLVRWPEIMHFWYSSPRPNPHDPRNLTTRPLYQRLPPARAFFEGWIDAARPVQQPAIWELRRLLPPDSPHALALDLAASRGYGHPVPEDIAATAAAHIEKFNGPPREPDWLAFQLAENLRLRKPVSLKDFEAFANAPITVRNAVLSLLAPLPETFSQGWRDDLQQRFLKDCFVRPPDPLTLASEAESAAYDRLQHFIQIHQTAHPDAQQLARSVLDAYLDRGARETRPLENIAISVLHSARTFEAYKRDVARRLAPEPNANAAIARAMHALHQYKIIHKNDESSEFARRLIELDPTDLPALYDCISHAVERRDTELVITALTALRHVSAYAFVEQLSWVTTVDLLTAEHLAQMVALLEQDSPDGAPPQPATEQRIRWIDGPRLTQLCRVMDARDRQLTDRFIRRLIDRKIIHSKALRDNLIPFCVETGGRNQVVIELLAELFAPPLTTAAASRDLRFPTARRFLFNASPEVIFAMEQLIIHNLAADMVRHLSSRPDRMPAADIGAALRHAADPTEEQFNREILPLLNRLNRTWRDGAGQRLEVLLRPLPGADQRKKWLDEGDPNTPTPQQLADRAQRLTSPEDAQLLRELWLASGTPQPGIPTRPNSVITTFVAPMIHFADDALWQEYAIELRKLKTQPTVHIALFKELAAVASPALRDRLGPLLLHFADDVLNLPGQTFSKVQILATAAWQADLPAVFPAILATAPGLDPERVPNELREAITELRIAIGDAEVAIPRLWARPGADGEWSVFWSFAGLVPHPPHLQGPAPVHAIDPAGFAGKFDLTLTATADGTRFHVLASIPAAEGRGVITVRAPAEAKFLHLTAEDRATKVRLEAPRLPLESCALPLFAEISTPDRAPAIRATPLPFDPSAPVIAVTLDPGAVVDLIKLPWQPGEALEFGAWMLVTGNTQLRFQAIDAEGRPLSPNPVSISISSRPIPRWHWISWQAPAELLSTADRIILQAYSKPETNRLSPPNTVWITDVRLKTTPEADLSPAERLGRLPGKITRLATTHDGSHVAAGLSDGSLIVFDCATSELNRFKVSPGRSLHTVLITRSHAAAIDSDHIIHHIDLASGAVEPLGRIEAALSDPTTTALSPDGRYLFANGPMADVIFVQLTKEGLRSPSAIPVGASPEFEILVAENLLVASGRFGYFRLPLTPLPDKASLEKLDQRPELTTARRKPGRSFVEWVDPVAQITIHPSDSGRLAYVAERRRLDIPAPPEKITITAQGRIFFTTGSGFLYALDSSRMPDFNGPATVPE